MLVQTVGLSQPLELSVFSIDVSALVDSPVEKGLPDWTVSNSGEYLLTGIANAVPQTTRQRAGRQAETVVGAGLPMEQTATTTITPDHDSRLPMPGGVIVKPRVAAIHKHRCV